MNTKDKDTNAAGQLISLFEDVERRANNWSLNGAKHPFKWHENVSGLLSPEDIEAKRHSLKQMQVDDYVTTVLDPAESANRPSAKDVISKLRGKIHNEFELGPLYSLEISLEHQGLTRRVAIIAQDRSIKNGVWSPEQHLEASQLVNEYDRRAVPIVTFMDTPGADAGTEANENNQAHTISRLIAVMAATKVPSVGIIYGLGYSGGAIPLATTNLLLAVRNAAFNTIQPKGLANIARQYNLSWQESARYVGVSPSELYRSGAIDGVIDWDPNEGDNSDEKLIAAIFTGIEEIESAAKREVLENPKVAADYLDNVRTEKLHKRDFNQLQQAADFKIYGKLTEYPSVYAHAIVYLRSLALRCRIHSSTIETYGRLAEEEIPSGDLAERTRQLREQSLEQWLSDPEKLVYNEQLSKAWNQLKQKHDELDTDRNKITALILGDPQTNYENAERNFCFVLCLYLYNRWKSDASFNFVEMGRMIAKLGADDKESMFGKPEADLTLLDTLKEPSIREALQDEFRNMLVFDALYNNIVLNFGEIAEESKAFQSLSEDTLKEILDTSLEKVASTVSGSKKEEEEAVDSDTKLEFAKWLAHFVRFDQRGEFLSDVEEWKRVNFPRMSDSLLVLITYFFETLVPRFIESQMSGKTYNGQINPGRIGKRKDFWNQLNIAYQDLLIQRVLSSYKRQKLTTVDAFIETMFSKFEETSANKMTANPVSFPGFRQSIEKALNNKITPCGVVTGIGKIKLGDDNTAKVGTLISNVAFQAGAFDMAGAEKLCTLLIDCAKRGLPVVCFVSSGGMQTKEGPSSLFSMAIVNDRITSFISETGLPIIIFGFGDCTGGSQASFVTHPLVHTYYFSGTDMPFAGRVVVPSFLPSMATTSNYLATTPGSMQGLVKHPFAEGLDEKLKEVDPDITLPELTVADVIGNVISGNASVAGTTEQGEKIHRAIDQMGEIKTVLIHARGCTAVKLIRIAQARGHHVLLVQSDPDMGSVACDMLGEQDEVVCLGGQTPGESYLNGLSVVTIARNRRADALHPGIGFLSENAGFARLCRANGLNFVGPKASSMDTMGNKSNAISTAMANDVPVVPGSHGILTSAEATAKVAEEIGYPVLLKAVHGGGGKGIKVVRNASEVRSAFSNVYSEARSAFGNGDLYLEKFVESMRHIEVQILRDAHGVTKVIGLRDCTVQRNNQKVLEESGSTMLPKHLEKMAYDCAAKLADAVDYFGAGTVEFIYDLKADSIYFMEMNTRLQVEHPVTEWTSGVQIVSTQFDIAQGSTIKDMKIANNGFSIEARITAEKARLESDGSIDFLPTPGLVTECEFPSGKHIEVIASVAEGKTISPFYDSMIAQLVVHGKNRKDAIKKLIAALDQTIIKGVCTNISLLKRILNDPTFIKGDYDTGYLPAFLDTLDKDQIVTEMAYTGVEKSDSDLSSLQIPGTDEIKVISPMTGIYYSAPSPTEADFVKVGDKVNLSQTLCQVEAMKLFTHISLSSVPGSGDVFTSDNEYEIVRVNQANSAQVNAGDLLFVIKPA